MSRRFLFLALSWAAWLLHSPAAAQGPPEGAAEGLADDPAWQQVGSFSGARSSGGQDFLGNEIFRESRNGDLFQDLGDLQIDLGHSWDSASVGLNATFKRRVVERHQALEPGSTIAPDELSYFQAINSALGKVQLQADYLQGRFDPFGVGLSSEAGFVITVAETANPRPLGDKPARRIRVGTTSQELHKYWDTHGIHFDRRILHDTGRAVVDFVGLLAGQIGSEFEDTEAGAEFFEGFVEPLTTWADLGVPIKAAVFTGPDSSLRVGDAVSYVVFIEIAPLAAGMDKWGVQVSMKGVVRFLRETTIVKQAGNSVLVRVKNIAAQGVETIPAKIRPELKWWIFRYGYTFLADRFDQSRFRASELVYDIDLNNPRAAEAFNKLLASGHHVQFKPLLEAAQAAEGVHILGSDYVGGNRHEHAFLARFPSGFRTDIRDIGVVRNVQTQKEHYQEATRAKLHTFRKYWGTDRMRTTRTVLTLQSAPLPLGERLPEKERPAGLTVSVQIRDKTANPAKLAYLRGLLRGTLEADWAALGLSDMVREHPPESEGVSLSLEVSVGRAQLDRMQALDEEDIWRELAAFYLGPTLRETWTTPGRRAYWRLRGPVAGKTGPAAPDIGRRFDAWLRAHPEVPRGFGISADAYGTSTAELFRRADGFMRRLDRLRKEAAFGRMCPECWSALYSDLYDVSFLQGLLVRGGGGIANGGVGYTAEIWTDSMFRPVRLSNGVTYTRERVETPPRAAIGSSPNALTGKPPSFSDTAVQSTDARAAVPDVESIDSSDARIRAGRLFAENASLGGASTPRLRLELYSDYRFDQRLRLRMELRRSRLRSDVPLRVQMLALPEPVEVRRSPFMVAQYRYDLDWEPPVELSPKESYAIYLRVINAAGEPVTEEEAVRLRLPAVRQTTTVAPAAKSSSTPPL